MPASENDNDLMDPAADGSVEDGVAVPVPVPAGMNENIITKSAPSSSFCHTPSPSDMSPINSSINHDLAKNESDAEVEPEAEPEVVRGNDDRDANANININEKSDIPIDDDANEKGAKLDSNDVAPMDMDADMEQKIEAVTQPQDSVAETESETETEAEIEAETDAKMEAADHETNSQKNPQSDEKQNHQKGKGTDEEETIALQMAAVAVAASNTVSESPSLAAYYAKNLSATIVHMPPNESANASANANNGSASVKFKKKGLRTPVHTVLVQEYIRKHMAEKKIMEDFLRSDDSTNPNSVAFGAGAMNSDLDGLGAGIDIDEGTKEMKKNEFEHEHEDEYEQNDVYAGADQKFAKGLNPHYMKHLLMVNHYDVIESKSSNDQESQSFASPPNSPNRNHDQDEDQSRELLFSDKFTQEEKDIASKAAHSALETFQQAEESYNHLWQLIPTDTGSSSAHSAGGGLESYDPNSSFTNRRNMRGNAAIPDLLPTYPSDDGDATNAFFKACAPLPLLEEENFDADILRSESLEVNVGTTSAAGASSSGVVSDGHGDESNEKGTEEGNSATGNEGNSATGNGSDTGEAKESANGPLASSPKKGTNDNPPPTLARNIASSFMGSVFSSVNRRRSRKRTDDASVTTAASSSVSVGTSTSDASSTKVGSSAPPSPPRVEQHVKIGVDYNVTIVREMLGLTVENVLERTVVRTVLPNGAAKKAGTKVGSLVVKVGTVETKNLTHFETIDELRQSQRPLKLVLRRIGKDSLRGAREEMGRLIKGGGFGICSDQISTDPQQGKNGEKKYEDLHLKILRQIWMEATQLKFQNTAATFTKRDEMLSKAGARLAWILSLLVVGLERVSAELKNNADEEGSFSSHHSDHSAREFEDAARSVSKILHDYEYKHFEVCVDKKLKAPSIDHQLNAATMKRKKQTAPPEHIQHEQRQAIPGATKRSNKQKSRAPGQQVISSADMELSQIGDVLHRARSFLADGTSPPAALLRGEVIALLCDILDLDVEMSLLEGESPSDSENSGLMNDLGSAGNLLKLIVLHCSNSNLYGTSKNSPYAGNQFLAVVHRLAASRSTSARVTACSLGPVLWGHLDFPHQLQLRGVITRALHDVEVIVRKSTATVLHEIAELVFDSRAVPWLVLMCERAMTDPEPQLRAAAMTLTWHLAEHLPNAFLGDASEGSRSIRGLPPRDDPKFAEVYLLQCKLLPVATRLAEDVAGSVRLAVAAQCDRLAGALGGHWHSVIIDLLQARLSDDDKKVRGEAVMCIPRLVENILSTESNIVGNDIFALESLLPVALKLQKDTIDVRMCLAAASGELLSFLVSFYHAEESGNQQNDTPSQKKYIDDTLIPLLQALLHDEEPEVTSAALRAVTNASRGHARDSSSRFDEDSLSVSSHQSNLIEKRDPVFRPVLSEDQVLRLVPTLSKLSASTQWRVRQSAVEIVPALLGCTQKLETRSEISQLCVKLMGDNVDAVRKSAAECLCLGGSNIGSNKSDDADEWLSAVVMPHLKACRDSDDSKQRLLSLKMVEMIIINIARWDTNATIVKEVHSEPLDKATLSLTSRALELASTLSSDKTVNVRLNVGRTFGNVLSVLNTDHDLEFIISTLEAQLKSEMSRRNNGDMDVRYFAKKSISLARERIKHLDDESSLR